MCFCLDFFSISFLLLFLCSLYLVYTNLCLCFAKRVVVQPEAMRVLPLKYQMVAQEAEMMLTTNGFQKNTCKPKLHQKLHHVLENQRMEMQLRLVEIAQTMNRHQQQLNLVSYLRKFYSKDNNYFFLSFFQHLLLIDADSLSTNSFSSFSITSLFDENSNNIKSENDCEPSVLLLSFLFLLLSCIFNINWLQSTLIRMRLFNENNNLLIKCKCLKILI